MATRSNIGVKLENGKYRVVYCHWDGYPRYNGKVLLENYSKQEKVEELVNMGSISALREEIGQKHEFGDDMVELDKQGWTTFYRRDRNEKWENVKWKEFDSLLKMLEYCDNDYTYLFCDGKWYYRKWNNNLQELTKDICNED